MAFNQVTIIGVGLIGGSFALALRRAGFDGIITGWGGQRSLSIALDRGIIDSVEESFNSGEICRSDLIYLACPINSIISFIETYNKQLKPGALLTDAGSTKQKICESARLHLPRSIEFIGGHPMAGSEKTGAENASADLFDGAAYIITPDEFSHPEPVAQLEVLIKELGARPITVSALHHDRAVALVSHLPQLLSTALAAAILKRGEADRLLLLSGRGFQDMTRLAASDWSIWGDIISTNRENILESISQMIGSLEEVKAALEHCDYESLKLLFKTANQAEKQCRAVKTMLESSTED